MSLLWHSLARTAKRLVPEAIKGRGRAFRWPMSWVDTLPGNSRLYGPARRWVSAERYFRWNPGHLRQVLPNQSVPTDGFVNCGPIPARFFRRLVNDIPAGALLHLPQARLVGPDGWIIGARDSYLLDASYWAWPDPVADWREHYMLIPRLSRPVRRLPGRTLSLASDFAIGGFGHFIHDSVTRLLLVERGGLDLRDFDWIYWPHPDSIVARYLVERAGIPPEKLIGWNGTYDLACDFLTATTFPGRPGHIAPVYADFLRRRFAPAASGRPRKIYLSRRGFRRDFRNAADVEAVLERHGYESCFAHQDADVLIKCAAASHVVAIEGANFFNAFACQPGTKTLLILPDAGPTLPYTLTLSRSAGHRVFLLAATSLDQPHVDPGIADIHLDPAVLAAALEQMDTT